MKIMKMVAAVSLALCSNIAFASGPLDGIYNCQISTAWGSGSIYVSVNSNASTTVLTIPYLQGVSYDGYVIGSAASDTAFSGTSSYGYAYTVTATGAVGAKTLLVSGTVYSTLYGPLAGTGTCSQII